MAYSSLAMSSLIFSHILPPLLAFIGIILTTIGVLDNKNQYTIAGISLFLIAGLSPFLILPLLLG